VIRQAQQVIGLPLLRKNGKAAGRVLDVWFDEFWRFCGVVLRERLPWPQRDVRVVRRERIASWGEDALMLEDGEAVERLDKRQLLRTFHTGVVRLKDMPVYTVDGQELGRVSDVYFRPNEGKPWIGYELTDGFLADVYEGRRRLLLPEDAEVVIGEDAILVPASCERMLERNLSGKEQGESV
jgi:uncharacterized protein YrrD